MKLNFRPSKVCFLDFETQSMAELNTVHKYASDETTRALTCVVKRDGVVHKFGPYLNAESREQLARITEGCTIVAHNAPFDEAIWRITEGLPEREWFDTLPCARAGGFPGKLDAISKIVTGRGKDPKGKQLIQLLCIIRNGRVPAIGPAHGLLMDYNVQDVEELEAIYGAVKQYGEPDVMQVDRIINDRGLPTDRALLLALKDLYARNTAEKRAEFDEITEGVLPTSPKQVKEWMEKQGFKVPGMGKSVMKDLLAKPEQFYIGDGDQSDFAEAFKIVMEAVEARREVVRVGKGKIDAWLEALEADDRTREMFVYYGAGPGRWAGRGPQLHNMPLAPKEIDAREIPATWEAVSAAADAASQEAGQRIGNTDVLNAMLRHVVRADNLNIADYGSVELRMTAWISGCEKMLKLLSDPSQSVYLDMGKELFGFPITKDDKAEYALSKALVLGCTYGMSGTKFDWLCKTRNVRTTTLEKMGKTAKDAVGIFRQTYPEIPELWRELGKAILDVVNYRIERSIAKSLIYMDKDNMHIQLPSGRPIVYRNARVEMLVPYYVKLYNMPEVPVPTVCYDGPRGFMRTLHGSKVCENIAQGSCRDFLAGALVNVESVGMHPVFHVHDEVGNEDEQEKFHPFMEIMSTPPSWAPNFPLLAEGYCGPLWTKKATGYEEAHYLNGKCVKHVKPKLRSVRAAG